MKTLKILALAAILGGTLQASAATKDYTAYVNPYIGSGGHGHVFVGANVRLVSRSLAR